MAPTLWWKADLAPTYAKNVKLHEDKVQLLEIVNLPEDGVHMPEEIPMNAFASQPSMFTQDTLQELSQCAMLLSQMSSTMLMRMMEEGAQSGYSNQHAGPLPDSYFISSNQQVPRPEPLTTATKEGKAAARKRKAPKEGQGYTD
ncbi:hypothetical protein C2845_PM12G14370 [Panicum miliaceum]|uniref:Uncharacterized protein n=1 Tax=Panicum miliaceum TaxID=4540 RepID=A0A3L6QFV4_PANMI|nr:hypothetical protein C2845_PM12G14370 [Panicum miliaceum]